MKKDTATPGRYGLSMPTRYRQPKAVLSLCVSLGMLLPVQSDSWPTCLETPIQLTKWPGSFGATVTTPIDRIISDPCFRSQIADAFAAHRLLAWAQQQITPDQELALIELLPHDATAPPAKAYGPLGVPGVDAEKYRRWRLPGLKQILLQGEGAVPAGHHGVEPGHLTSGKPVKEWHTDGLYEQDTPSIATSMYCVSVKPVGGDTLFMDARAIYQALDSDEKKFWECATARYSRIPLSMHSSGYRSLLQAELANVSLNTGGLYASAQGRSVGDPTSTVHPAVWQLPDGGHEKALIVAPMWISELRDQNGVALAHDELHRKLEKTLAKGKPTEVAHSWSPGDFVVWDNRALLHSATPNDGFSREGLRLLHRIRLCGDQVPTAPESCLLTK